MSSTKALLKAIGDTVKQQKYDEAIQQAESFLQKDSKNYQA
jgi:superkiller protein 3